MLNFSRLKAFTLIELLIVITIIGILSVALVPRIVGGPSKARDAQRMADLQQIATALELYAQDHGGAYPVGPICVANLAALNAYMTNIPNDPKGLAAKTCGTGYVYFELEYAPPVDTIPNSYGIAAALETTSKTGPNIFDHDGFKFLPFTESFATKMSDHVGDLCGGATADCPTNGSLYVIGR